MDQTDARVAAVREIGPDSIALDIETPDGFDARPGQFVKLSGGGESRFYTISSPDVDGTFEVTIEVDP
jgi:ferredoxin-NADP reductase